MTWHDDATTRKALGDGAEKDFAAQVGCGCGGRFDFVGDVRPGFPDFTCTDCGRLVDVKSSPQSERTGNIAVSATPWQNYPDDMLLVTRIQGRWVGEYKANITPKNNKPFEPTHNTRNSKLGNTKFYLISWLDFRPVTERGLVLG